MDYIDLFNARTTRQQSSVAVSQNSDKAFRYNMNLPVNETALGQKRGFMVFDSDTGRRLTWEFTKWLGDEIIKNRTYFYVISSDAGAIDEIDGKGKIKLGYSASAAGSTQGYAQRVTDYIKWWGPSARLHMLILFKTKTQATNFESACKKALKHTFENAANVRSTQPIDYQRQHEFFRYNKKNNVMNIVRDTYLNSGEFSGKYNHRTSMMSARARDPSYTRASTI